MATKKTKKKFFLVIMAGVLVWLASRFVVTTPSPGAWKEVGTNDPRDISTLTKSGSKFIVGGWTGTLVNFGRRINWVDENGKSGPAWVKA